MPRSPVPSAPGERTFVARQLRPLFRRVTDIGKLGKFDAQHTVPISNVVATGYHRNVINLKDVGRQTKNGKYNRTQFNYSKLSFLGPQGTTLLFLTSEKKANRRGNERGSLLAIGCKHPSTTRYVLAVARERIGQILQRPMLATRTVISNVVYTGILPYWVNVARMFAENPLYTDYDPERFPGLYYYVFHDMPELVERFAAAQGTTANMQTNEDTGERRPGLKIALFEGGKFNLVGFFDPELVSIALRKLYAITEQYKKDALDAATDANKFERRIAENSNAMREIAERQNAMEEDYSESDDEL